MYKVLDGNYSLPRAKTFSEKLKQEHAPIADPTTGEVDPLVIIRRQIVKTFQEDAELMSKFDNSDRGVTWGELKFRICEILPENYDNRDQLSFTMVPQVLNELLGDQDIHWESFKNQNNSTCVRRRRP